MIAKTPSIESGANLPDAAEGSETTDQEATSRDLDRLRAELDALRLRNAQLTLALQVERVRNEADSRDWESSGTWEDGESTNWLDQASGWLNRPRISVGDVAASALATIYRRLLPAQEAPAAATWRLAGWEWAALLLIVALAAFLRYYHLSSVPPGVQGDEAAMAIEAGRARHEGWIGPYSSIAAGTPTGMVYIVALFQVLFGDSIHTVRLVVATAGTLTVPLLYFLARRSFGRWAGLAAAGALAVTGWHIHYSRMAFPNNLWPLAVSAAFLALAEAYRTGSRTWWAAAGTLFGLGIYTYNSHAPFLILVGAYLGVLFFGPVTLIFGSAILLAAADPGFLSTATAVIGIAALLATQPLRARSRLAGALALLAPLVLVALPLIRYAANERNNYFGYSERLSIFNSEEWKAKQSDADRLRFLVDRYVDYWDRLSFHPRFDGVDASGTVPLIPPAMLLLAALGVALALWRGQRIIATLGTIVLLALPLASALSVDFALRRTLLVSMLVALFAGVGTAEATRLAWRRQYTRYAIVPLVGLFAVVSIRQNLDDYFDGTAKSAEIKWVDAVEMVALSKYIATLPDGSYVYLLSERWPFSHEIRRYFAPDAVGENRSENFGEHRLPYDPTKGRPVYILVGRYEADLEQLQALYPGGEVIRSGNPDNPDFIAFFPPWPPASSSPPLVVPAATPTTDQQRG